MPITKPVLEKYVSENFVETGTASGRASMRALKVGFKKIWTVEKNTNRIKMCKKRFDGIKNINFYTGDSREFLRKVIKQINGSITYWLDAHTNTWSPLLEELDIIKENMNEVPIILIDDVSLFGAYRITKKQVKNKLLEIFPDYKISYEDGKQKNKNGKKKDRKNDLMVAQL